MLANKAACIPAAVARAATVARGVASARSPCHRLPASAIAAPLSAPVVAALFSTSTHAAHFERNTSIPSEHPNVRGVSTSARLHAERKSPKRVVARTLFAKLEGGAVGSEVEVEVDPHWTIARVKKEVQKELSLEGTPLRDIILYHETAGGVLLPLDGAATVDEALPAGTGVTRIAVKVATTAKPMAATASDALVEYPPDHSMSQLARGIMAATEGSDATGATGVQPTITLPPGIFWPDMRSTVLYVRYFYKDLWEAVLNEGRSNDDICDAVIMGTPGVAKSAFGLYALYRAVKEGRTVIYVSLKGGSAVFKGGKAYQIGARQLAEVDEMSDPNALYISDSMVPVAHLKAFRLLITSPKKETWSKFAQSPDTAELVLPTFTLEEMLKLREVAFSEKPLCSEEEVKERFRLWGGSARSVLTHANNKAKLDRLTTVAESLDLATVEKSMQGSRALDGVGGSDYVHRLLELVPRGVALPDEKLATSDPDFYRFHHTQLISDHVVGLFGDSLLKKHKSELYRFLHEAASDPAAATLRGKLYERCIAVPRFVQGPRKGCDGQLALVRLSPTLTPQQPTWLTVPKLSFKQGLPRVHYRDLAELAGAWTKGTADTVFVPFSKEFPAVDFVLRVGGRALLANATVGESHDVKPENEAFWAELLNAVGLADETKEVPLAWVLDKHAFERFNDAGQVKSQSGGNLVSGTTARHHIGRRLAQYKLLLEVPPVVA